MSERKTYTSPEAAEKLSISKDGMRKLVERGGISPLIFGRQGGHAHQFDAKLIDVAAQLVAAGVGASCAVRMAFKATAVPSVNNAAPELLSIVKRLIQWDRDYPVNSHNGYEGLKELDKIISDGKALVGKATGELEPEGGDL